MPDFKNEMYVGFTSSKEDTIWFDEEENSVATQRTVPGISIHDPNVGTVTVPLELLPKSVFHKPDLSGLQLTEVVKHINDTYCKDNPIRVPPVNINKILAQLPQEYIEQVKREQFTDGFDNKPEVVKIDNVNKKEFHKEYPVLISQAITVKEDESSLEVEPFTETTYGFLVEQFDKSVQAQTNNKGALPHYAFDKIDYVKQSGAKNLGKVSDYNKLLQDRPKALAWAACKSPVVKELLTQAANNPGDSPPLYYNNAKLSPEVIHAALNIAESTEFKIEYLDPPKQYNSIRNKPA